MPKAEEKIPPNKEASTVLKLYKSRWIILIVQCMLNITNNMIFGSTSSVANFVNDYYENKSANTVISIVYLAVSVPLFIIALVVAERVGLRFMVIIATFLNALGAAIRIVSNVDGLASDYRFALLITGQAVVACSKPATMLMNTKIPSLWFPIEHRALATALLSTAGPLGILIISPVASALVQSPNDLMKLNILVFVPAAVTFLFALITVRRSSPPSPPSLSANNSPLSQMEGLKLLAKNRSYIVLNISLGSGLGLFSLYYTTMEQSLCGRGYGNSFAAMCTALMIAGGLVGATVAGMVADRTKLFDEIFKTCLCAANLFGLGFTESVIHVNMEAFIATFICIFGTFGIAYYAVGNEISAEITYPTSETLSAGLIGLSGQIQGVLYLLVWGLLTQPLSDEYRNIQQCTFSGQTLDEASLVEKDTLIPLFFFAIACSLIAMMTVICFKPKYLRLGLEAKTKPKSADVVKNGGVTKF